MSEKSYIAGNRAAWAEMLKMCLSKLGYDSPEASQNEWIIERESAIAALHLPRSIVKWAFVRVFAVASTGKYSLKEAGSITCFEAVRAWDEEYEQSISNGNVKNRQNCIAGNKC